MKSPSQEGREAIRKALNDKAKVSTKVHKEVISKQQATEARLREERDEREREKHATTKRAKSHVEVAIEHSAQQHNKAVEDLVDHVVEMLSPEKKSTVPSSAKKGRPQTASEEDDETGLPPMSWELIKGKKVAGLLRIGAKYGFEFPDITSAKKMKNYIIDKYHLF